ncbi:MULTISPECIES: 2-keto-4-pentenoate hydratase [Rhodococcus]|uniref:2-hydroxypenta-2,4-dienoate hydratase n=1 Tax=Rhodococcus jostii (strain RHA1) TaxID=101510 RepID=Q0RWM6_RHOJR|nr:MULTISPECIES: fumarylacetoacetate hydrolase family protein [Rhodococcus]AAR90116.1 putative 2-hydroxypenta-2,4-dienoate hydratase [Rhodococcus sp. DK17]ABH00310.1 2-hydroxypenta-2,4-dienoate hydratase [Rhodococcus jostii RHA1]
MKATTTNVPTRTSLNPAVNDTPVQRAADRLAEAAHECRPCLPVRDLLSPGDISAAYAVQQILTEKALASGRRIVGRKIGLTSRAVQQQLGVDQPDFGVLFADMARKQHIPIAIDRLLQPKVEAEIAFMLSEDLADGNFDLARIRSAAGTAVAALEIVDSRIRDWDITIVDTVADNASSAQYVIGDDVVTVGDLDLTQMTMTMAADGAQVSSGTGADCLGDPMHAVQWLARTVYEYGSPLRAGDLVLSGALGPVVPVESGRSYTATISGLGSVKATFEKGEMQ